MDILTTRKEAKSLSPDTYLGSKTIKITALPIPFRWEREGPLYKWQLTPPTFNPISANAFRPKNCFFPDHNIYLALKFLFKFSTASAWRHEGRCPELKSAGSRKYCQDTKEQKRGGFEFRCDASLYESIESSTQLQSDKRNC